MIITTDCFTVSSETSITFYTNYFLRNALTAIVHLDQKDTNFLTKSTRLDEQNFIYRFIYKDKYWTYFNLYCFFLEFRNHFHVYVRDVL